MQSGERQVLTTGLPSGLGGGDDGLAVPTSPGFRADIAFAALCLAIAGGRFLVLIGPGAPPGIDGGNWLSLGHALMGHSVRSSKVVYPPLVPLLVASAVRVFGPMAGMALVAVGASLSPAVGAYVVLRSSGLRLWGALLAGLLAPMAATGEATAWGGYPQLLATGLGVVSLWMFDRGLRLPPARRTSLITGGLLAMTLATSHFIGAMVVMAAAVMVGLHLLLFRGDADRPTRRETAGGLLLVALPCLPLLPLYVVLGKALTSGFGARPSALRVSVTSLTASVERLYRDFPLPWRPVVAVGVVTPLLMGPARRRPLWTIPTSLLVSMGVFLVATGEGRALYVLPVVAVMTAGFWLDALKRLNVPTLSGRRVVTGVLVLTLAIGSVTGLRFFVAQRDYYTVLTPGVVAGIDWIQKNTSPNTVVAVTSVEDAPLGWWVEGLGRRRTYSGSDVKWLYVEDERDRARTANEIFGPADLRQPEFPRESSFELAARAGVRYLFVAKAWGGYGVEGDERFRAAHPAAFVFENESVVILSVSAVA